MQLRGIQTCPIWISAARASGASMVILLKTQSIEDENGSLIENPIVFTDSFLLPWVCRYGSRWTLHPAGSRFISIHYWRTPWQPKGWWLSSSCITNFWIRGVRFLSNSGKRVYARILGKPNQLFCTSGWKTSFSREANQYDKYLVKTTLKLNDSWTRRCRSGDRGFTNTNDQGYRLLADDNFILLRRNSSMLE